MHPLLDQLLRRLGHRRRRVWLAHALVAAGALAVALYLNGHGWLALVLVLLPLLPLGPVHRPLDQSGPAALIGALDRRFPELEDSSALLLRGEAGASALEARQRERVGRRLRARVESERGVDDLLDDLTRATPGERALAIIAVLLAAGLLWLPRAMAPEPRLQIEVRPPDYLEQEVFRAAGPELSVPAGSTVTWTLLHLPPDRQARWIAGSGAARPLGPDETVVLPVDEDLVYRVEWDEADGRGGLTGLVTVEQDRPPRLTLLAPSRWPVEFRQPDPEGLRLRLSAEDDQRVSDAALLLTVARGEGEAVKFRERRQALTLPADRAPDRVEFDLRLLAQDLEMEPGDELYAQFEVRDNRRPQAGVSRSPTVVFRWRGDRGGALSLSGMPVDRMPDYFRSQRQIIIDTETLLQDRPQIQASSFRSRSQALARDQRALRLRYGQYLGEEAESGAGPVSPALETALQPEEEHGDGDEHEHEDHQGEEHAHAHAHAHAGEDDHAHGAGAPGHAGPGPDDGAGDILELFGHSHDFAEQATLFDPGTRATLKAALAAMWRAELQLALNAPEAALTPEYEALERLKAVQQANRIYVKRVGFEPPPLSEERRLSGDFEAADPSAAPRPATPATLARRALDTLLAAAPGDPVDARLLARLSAARDYPGPLRLAAERLRAAPDCASCRRALLGGLWALTEAPPPPALRPALPASPDDARRYAERRAEAPSQHP